MRELIVHIIDRLPPDGAERLIAEVLNNRGDQFRYHVLCLVEGGALVEEIERDGVSVTVLGRRSGHDISHAFHLYRWLKKHKPMVVHTHLFTADAWGRTFAWIARVPGIFTTVHSTNTWKSKLHLRIDWLLSFVSDAVIACTDEVKVKLLSQGISNSKLVAIANGVDLKRMESTPIADLNREFGIPSGLPTFALVGRLHEAKGHTDLLPVLESLAKEGLPFRCLFVGTGELEESLRQDVSTRDLGAHVIFTGFRSDVPGIMKAIDFLVMPSRWEGLPISLLEGMACSSPVVASRVGGIPDVIDHELDGYLYEQGNKGQLLSCLRSMLQNSKLRASMAIKGKKKIEASYSAGSVAIAYETLYQEVQNAL